MTRPAAALLLLFPLMAGAAELKGGYPACISEETFSQYVQAQVDEDQRGQEYLISNNLCVITAGGIPVTVLDRTWTGTVHVRAYAGDTALELWTYMENVVKD